MKKDIKELIDLRQEGVELTETQKAYVKGYNDAMQKALDIVNEYEKRIKTK